MYVYEYVSVRVCTRKCYLDQIQNQGLVFAVSIPNHVVVATASWGCLGQRGEAYTPV